MLQNNIVKETSEGYQLIPIADDTFINDRIIWFTDSVTPESCETLASQLYALEKAAPGREITVFLNTPGGDVYSGLCVYDIMRSISSPIRTVVFGVAASMGAILFLGGDERIVMPHAHVLIHDPHYACSLAGLKALDLQADVEQLLRSRETTAQIISERTGKPIEEVYEQTKNDRLMSAQEALDFGLATMVGLYMPVPQNNNREETDSNEQ